MADKTPDISIVIDAKLSDISGQVDEYEKSLKDLKESAHKAGVDEQFAHIIDDAIASLHKARDEFADTLKSIADQKLDTADFEEFSKTVSEEFEKIDERMENAEELIRVFGETLGNMDSSHFVEEVQRIENQFKNLKGEIALGMRMLRNFQKMMAQNRELEKQNEIQKLINTQDNITKKTKSDLEDTNLKSLKRKYADAYKAAESAYQRQVKLEEEYDNTYKDLTVAQQKRMQQEIKDAKLNVLKLTEDFKQVYMRLQEISGKQHLSFVVDGLTYDTKRGDIEKEYNLKEWEDIKEERLKALESDKYIYDYKNKKGYKYYTHSAQHILERVKDDIELRNMLASDMAAANKRLEEQGMVGTKSVDQFQVKNGKVTIPIVLDPDMYQKVKDNYESIMKTLQDYSDKHPVSITFKLFPNKAKDATQSKEIQESLKNITTQVDEIEDEELKTKLNGLVTNISDEYAKALQINIAVKLSDDYKSLKAKVESLKKAVADVGKFGIDVGFNPIKPEDKKEVKDTIKKASEGLEVVFNTEKITKQLSDLTDESRFNSWLSAFLRGLDQIREKLSGMQELVKPLKEIMDKPIGKRGKPTKEDLENRSYVDTLIKSIEHLDKLLDTVSNKKIDPTAKNVGDFLVNTQEEVDEAGVPIVVPVVPDIDGFIDSLVNALNEISIPINIIGNVNGGTIVVNGESEGVGVTINTGSGSSKRGNRKITNSDDEEIQPEQPKRGRGRPRKNKDTPTLSKAEKEKLAEEFGIVTGTADEIKTQNKLRTEKFDPIINQFFDLSESVRRKYQNASRKDSPYTASIQAAEQELLALLSELHRANEELKEAEKSNHTKAINRNKTAIKKASDELMGKYKVSQKSVDEFLEHTGDSLRVNKETRLLENTDYIDEIINQAIQNEFRGKLFDEIKKQDQQGVRAKEAKVQKLLNDNPWLSVLQDANKYNKAGRIEEAFTGFLESNKLSRAVAPNDWTTIYQIFKEYVEGQGSMKGLRKKPADIAKLFQTYKEQGFPYSITDLTSNPKAKGRLLKAWQDLTGQGKDDGSQDKKKEEWVAKTIDEMNEQELRKRRTNDANIISGWLEGKFTNIGTSKGNVLDEQRTLKESLQWLQKLSKGEDKDATNTYIKELTQKFGLTAEDLQQLVDSPTDEVLENVFQGVRSKITTVATKGMQAALDEGLEVERLLKEKYNVEFARKAFNADDIYSDIDQKIAQQVQDKQDEKANKVKRQPLLDQIASKKQELNSLKFEEVVKYRSKSDIDSDPRIIKLKSELQQFEEEIKNEQLTQKERKSLQDKINRRKQNIEKLSVDQTSEKTLRKRTDEEIAKDPRVIKLNKEITELQNTLRTKKDDYKDALKALEKARNDSQEIIDVDTLFNEYVQSINKLKAAKAKKAIKNPKTKAQQQYEKDRLAEIANAESLVDAKKTQIKKLGITDQELSQITGKSQGGKYQSVLQSAKDKYRKQQEEYIEKYIQDVSKKIDEILSFEDELKIKKADRIEDKDVILDELRKQLRRQLLGEVPESEGKRTSAKAVKRDDAGETEDEITARKRRQETQRLEQAARNEEIAKQEEYNAKLRGIYKKYQAREPETFLQNLQQMVKDFTNFSFDSKHIEQSKLALEAFAYLYDKYSIMVEQLGQTPASLDQITKSKTASSRMLDAVVKRMNAKSSSDEFEPTYDPANVDTRSASDRYLERNKKYYEDQRKKQREIAEQKERAAQAAKQESEYEALTTEELQKKLKAAQKASVDNKTESSRKKNAEKAKTIQKILDQRKKEGEEQGDSFVNGVEAQTDEAKEAGQHLGEATNEGAKEATDESSPSKVAEQIGYYYGVGWKEGLLKSEDEIIDAITVLMNQAKLTAEDLIADDVEDILHDPIKEVLYKQLDELITGVKNKGGLEKLSDEELIDTYEKFIYLNNSIYKHNPTDEEDNQLINLFGSLDKQLQGRGLWYGNDHEHKSYGWYNGLDRIRDYNDKNYSSAPSLDEVESKAVEVSGTINTLLSKKDVIEKLRNELQLTKEEAEDIFNQQNYSKKNNKYEIEKESVDELIASLKEKNKIETEQPTTPQQKEEKSEKKTESATKASAESKTEKANATKKAADEAERELIAEEKLAEFVGKGSQYKFKDNAKNRLYADIFGREDDWLGKVPGYLDLRGSGAQSPLDKGSLNAILERFPFLSLLNGIDRGEIESNFDKIFDAFLKTQTGIVANNAEDYRIKQAQELKDKQFTEALNPESFDKMTKKQKKSAIDLLVEFYQEEEDAIKNHTKELRDAQSNLGRVRKEAEEKQKLYDENAPYEEKTKYGTKKVFPMSNKDRSQLKARITKIKTTEIPELEDKIERLQEEEDAFNAEHIAKMNEFANVGKKYGVDIAKLAKEQREAAKAAEKHEEAEEKVADAEERSEKATKKNTKAKKDKTTDKPRYQDLYKEISDRSKRRKEEFSQAEYDKIVGEMESYIRQMEQCEYSTTNAKRSLEAFKREARIKKADVTTQPAQDEQNDLQAELEETTEAAREADNAVESVGDSGTTPPPTNNKKDGKGGGRKKKTGDNGTPPPEDPWSEYVSAMKEFLRSSREYTRVAKDAIRDPDNFYDVADEQYNYMKQRQEAVNRAKAKIDFSKLDYFQRKQQDEFEIHDIYELMKRQHTRDTNSQNNINDYLSIRKNTYEYILKLEKQIEQGALNGNNNTVETLTRIKQDRKELLDTITEELKKKGLSNELDEQDVEFSELEKKNYEEIITLRSKFLDNKQRQADEAERKRQEQVRKENEKAEQADLKAAMKRVDDAEAEKAKRAEQYAQDRENAESYDQSLQRQYAVAEDREWKEWLQNSEKMRRDYDNKVAKQEKDAVDYLNYRKTAYQDILAIQEQIAKSEIKGEYEKLEILNTMLEDRQGWFNDLTEILKLNGRKTDVKKQDDSFEDLEQKSLERQALFAADWMKKKRESDLNAIEKQIQADEKRQEQVRKENEKLAEQMANGREKAAERRRAEEEKLNRAQSDAINKAQDEEFKSVGNAIREATKETERWSDSLDQVAQKSSDAAESYDYRIKRQYEEQKQAKEDREWKKQLQNNEKMFRDYDKKEGNQQKQREKEQEAEQVRQVNDAYTWVNEQVTEYIKLRKLIAQGKATQEETKRVEELAEAINQAREGMSDDEGNLLDPTRWNKATKGLNGLEEELIRIAKARKEAFEQKVTNTQSKLKAAAYDVQFEIDHGSNTAEFSTRLTKIRDDINAIASKEIDVVTEEDLKQATILLERVRQIRKEGKLSANKTANENSRQKGLAQINSILSANTKRAFRKTDTYKDLVALQKQFDSFDTSRPQSELNELTTKLLKTKADFEALDDTVKGTGFFGTFVERLRGINAQLLAQYFSWHDIIRYGRQMISTIIDLDTQLVDLRKTTKMNNTELDAFYKESSNVAKGLGVTTSEIISQAAAWSRLNKIGPLYSNI